MANSTWDEYNTIATPQTETHARFGLKLFEEDRAAILQHMATVPWDERWIWDMMLETNAKHLKFLSTALKRFTYKPGKGSITDEDIARAKSVKIESLFAGSLRKVGTKYWGKCPFHQEKSGSFCIYTHENSFHCFGCGIHGNTVVDYIMMLNKVTFIEAVKILIS